MLSGTQKELDLEAIPDHRDIGKLRDLNNTIKHTGARNIHGLDKKYEQFRVKVPKYIFRL